MASATLDVRTFNNIKVTSIAANSCVGTDSTNIFVAITCGTIQTITPGSANIVIGGTSTNPTIDLGSTLTVATLLKMGPGGSGLQGSTGNGTLALSASVPGGYSYVYTCTDDNFHECIEGGIFGDSLVVSNTNGGAQFALSSSGDIGIPGSFSSGALSSHNNECLTAVSLGSVTPGAETNGGQITGTGFACPKVTNVVAGTSYTTLHIESDTVSVGTSPITVNFTTSFIDAPKCSVTPIYAGSFISAQPDGAPSTSSFQIIASASGTATYTCTSH